MAKVHPNAAAAAAAAVVSEQPLPVVEEQPPTVLTVWRKSLLFNCEGFTVFDARGDLTYRVDCYGSSSGSHGRGRSRGRRAEDVVLMDAAGKSLLTVRRKVSLSLAESWVVYDGDGLGAAAKPLLSVRRHAAAGLGLLRRVSGVDRAKAAVAHVTPLLASSGGGGAEAGYVVEGSYGRRSCAVRDARGAPVAEVRRKEAVGDDVFRLVVPEDPRLGAALAMGVVIALDQMFGGGSLLPRSWSAK